MADIDISQYQIGNNTYHYRDALSIAGLEGKVNKETGKSLMLNTDKTKLDGIEDGATKVIVDSFFVNQSTNPVQSKVIKQELDNIKSTYAAPATVENPNGVAGVVKVAESLNINENGFLGIKNLATIELSREQDVSDVEIATYTDNNGNEGSLSVPYVAISPSIVTGDRVKIADFNVGGNVGELYAPAGGGGGEGDLNAVELTKAQYDALPMEDKIDETKVYFITDYTPGGASLGWGRGTLEETITYTSSGTFIEWGVGDRIDYNFSATKSTLNPSLEDRQIICQGVKAYIVDANDDYVEDVDFFLTKAYNTEVSNAQTYKVDGYILNTSSSAYSLPLKVKYEIEIMYV